MRKNIAVIGAFLLTYLFISFISWEINPANWAIEIRFIAIFVSLVWSYSTISYIELQDKK